MSDIPLEIIRAMTTGSICAYLFVVGKNKDIRHQRGWTFIIAGFGLIFFGTLIDISDNFPTLNKYLVIGDTEYEAFLEKVVGYLSGFLLLAIGLVQWMPTVVALKHTQNELRESHNEMELKVKERTFDLKAINERLEEEIIERKNTADMLRKFSHAVEQGASSVIITDLDGNIEYTNSRFTRLTGYTPEEAIGQNPRILQSGNHSGEFYKELWGTITSGRVWRGEFHNKKKDGELYWELGSISPIRNSEGTITSFIALKEDITERKLMERKLESLSMTDELTGLNNRRGFFSLGERLLKLAKREKNGMFIFYGDLNGLKGINDTFGHNEGDNALIDFANILKATYRETDIIARIGGDEFAVLPAGTSEDCVEKINARLQEKIVHFNATNDRRYNLSVSVGAAYFNPESPSSLDELLAQGDKIMYEQKMRKKKS